MLFLFSHSVREWCYVLLLQVWDEITILEETESGKQVSSVIKVPSQVFNTIILSTSASLDALCTVRWFYPHHLW